MLYNLLQYMQICVKIKKVLNKLTLKLQLRGDPIE